MPKKKVMGTKKNKKKQASKPAAKAAKDRKAESAKVADFLYRAESEGFREKHFPTVVEAEDAMIRSPFGAKIPAKYFKRCTSSLVADGTLLGICTKVPWKEGAIIGRYLGKPLTVAEANAVGLKTRAALKKWKVAQAKYEAGKGKKPTKSLAEVAAPAAYLFDVQRRVGRDPGPPDMDGMARISTKKGKGIYMPPKHWRLDGSPLAWSSWTRYINAAFPHTVRYKKQNVRFIQYGEGIYVVAIRDIKKGEELIGWYGKDTEFIVFNTP